MCGGEEKCVQGFWWGNLNERGNLEDIHVDGKILKWASIMGVFRTGFVRLGMGQVSGCCEKVMKRWAV
jgi:hypothetical protein